MSVYCVNSGNAHADLYTAENAEHGQHVGLVIFLVTGFDTSSPVFSGSGYDDVHVKAAGGFTWDGKESSLTAGLGSVNSSADTITIDDLSVKYMNLSNSPSTLMRRCFVGHGNTGGTVASSSNSYTSSINNCVVDGTVKTISGTTNPNFKLNNCTFIKSNGYGVIRGDVINSALLNTGSATMVVSTNTNTFTDDGAQGSINNLAESDFVDYANGDYRLKADSAAALAGAGAFIEDASQPTFQAELSGVSSFSFSSESSVSADVPVNNVGALSTFSFSSQSGVSTDKPQFHIDNLSGFGFSAQSVATVSAPEKTTDLNSSFSFSSISGIINTTVGVVASVGSSYGFSSSSLVEHAIEPSLTSVGTSYGFSAEVEVESTRPEYIAASFTGWGFSSQSRMVNGAIELITPSGNFIQVTFKPTTIDYDIKERFINV